MCGIVGIWLKNESAIVQDEQLRAGISAMKHRGPDIRKIKIDANVGMAHARLSIQDLSDSAHQPMSDESGRYTLIFNGEIYNREEIKKLLPTDTILKTNSDTEVLLYFLIAFKLEKLNDLNGFFSFALYDNECKEMIFARDRYGIKPLFIYEDKRQIILTSEVSALLNFDIDKSVNLSAVNLLFQLTYIPAPYSIFKKAKAVLPGNCGTIKNGIVNSQCFYSLKGVKPIDISYEAAKKMVKSKLEVAVKRRMISDVPLGTFLSGGVDSSIISLIAKQHKVDLKTFSIGFDVAYFDESGYAKTMAKSIKSNHHSITLTHEDFRKRFKSFVDLNHQPFADSSAFAVYLLSEKTKEHVTVCLSGDGADELFGGYRKHEAEFKIKKLSGIKKFSLKALARIGKLLPKGRHGKWLELNRKVQKLADSVDMTVMDRYWNWLKFISNQDRQKLLIQPVLNEGVEFCINEDINSVLLADQSFVLPNDMLTKVDRMSMAHGLEVRTPFLDHELVDFVNSLPSNYKVNKNGRKQILIDAFKDHLPAEIYSRKKKGFEIPLFDWLKDEIVEAFKSDIFSKPYIEKQNIFNFNYIKSLEKSMNSKQFGEKIYLVWTLIIFQNWWAKNML